MLNFIIEKYLAFVDYRTEGQVDSMTNRRGNRVHIAGQTRSGSMTM